MLSLETSPHGAGRVIVISCHWSYHRDDSQGLLDFYANLGTHELAVEARGSEDETDVTYCVKNAPARTEHTHLTLNMRQTIHSPCWALVIAIGVIFKGTVILSLRVHHPSCDDWLCWLKLYSKTFSVIYDDYDIIQLLILYMHFNCTNCTVCKF